MRTAPLAVFAALAAMSTNALPATSRAESVTPVQIRQTATRTAGRCTYTATLRGSYTVHPSSPRGTPVRDAIIDVETTLACRGEQPVTSLRQVYYASTLEETLLARLADIARMDRSEGSGHCSFMPALQRQGTTVQVTDIATSCPASRRSVRTRVK